MADRHDVHGWTLLMGFGAAVLFFWMGYNLSSIYGWHLLTPGTFCILVGFGFVISSLYISRKGAHPVKKNDLSHVKVSLIAAVGENGVMGKSGSANHSLPWDIKSEFQYFRKTTMGKPLIFGRKTLETLGKPLPGRQNIIVTRDKNYNMAGTLIAHSVEEAIHIGKMLADWEGKKEIFIGGGAEIYKQALPACDRLYLTEVHMRPDGDTVFPDFDRSAFVEVKREFHAKKPGESADYTITVLERRKTA